MKTHIAILTICAGLYYIGTVVFSKSFIAESYGFLMLAYFIGGFYILDSVVGWMVNRRG